VKISIFSIPQMPQGKVNIKDTRLDEIHQITNTKKKTYVQVELTGEGALLEADAILVLKDSRADLILKDLEFVETRLSRAEQDPEKDLLNKLKGILEKEEFIFNAGLSQDEKQAISAYGLLSNRLVVTAETQELDAQDNLLKRAIDESGHICFFTATGDRETRGWLIKKGATAWEAAGSVHSDIQKGFIRAEVISFNDFIQSGGESKAKQAGKMHLEQKDYVIQDGDVVNFRFNK